LETRNAEVKDLTNERNMHKQTKKQLAPEREIINEGGIAELEEQDVRVRAAKARMEVEQRHMEAENAGTDAVLAQTQAEKVIREAEQALVARSNEQQKLQRQVKKLTRKASDLQYAKPKQVYKLTQDQVKKVKREAEKTVQSVEKEQRRLQRRIEDLSNKYTILKAEVRIQDSSTQQQGLCQQHEGKIEAPKAKSAGIEAGDGVDQRKLAKKRDISRVQELLAFERQEKKRFKKKHTIGKATISKLETRLKQSEKCRKSLEKKLTKEIERRGRLKERLAQARKKNRNPDQALAVLEGVSGTNLFYEERARAGEACSPNRNMSRNKSSPDRGSSTKTRIVGDR
jgi:hypothetical protein